MLIMEPWAEEYALVEGEVLDVVAINPTVVPTFGVETHDGALVVWVKESGSTFELWRSGILMDDMAIPIPSLPPQKNAVAK